MSVSFSSPSPVGPTSVSLGKEAVKKDASIKRKNSTIVKSNEITKNATVNTDASIQTKPEQKGTGSKPKPKMLLNLAALNTGIGATKEGEDSELHATRKTPKELATLLTASAESHGLNPKDCVKHAQVLFAAFPNSDTQQLKVVHDRLVKYAALCDIEPNEMFEKIGKGHQVAQKIEIEKNEIEKGHTVEHVEHSVDDVVNVDWFMRAHMAKKDQLFLKGTAKMADPGGWFAKFVLNAKGQLRGSDLDPYGRDSTHFPEQKKNLKDFLRVGNEFLTYSKSVADKLKAQFKDFKVHNLDALGITPCCIGIDASSKEGGLGLAGKNNETFLFMPMHENRYDGKGEIIGSVQVMAWKTEGHSAALPTQGGSTKEVILHGYQAFLKKVLDVQAEVDVDAPGMRDLKEDKLNPDILSKLNGLEMMTGSEKGVNSELGNKLKASYKALEETTASGCDCGIQELKQHLENMLKVPALDGEQKNKAELLLNTINKLNSICLSGSENHKFLLLPRSEEVILPSLSEMLEDKTSFRGNIKEK